MNQNKTDGKINEKVIISGRNSKIEVDKRLASLCGEIIDAIIDLASAEFISSEIIELQFYNEHDILNFLDIIEDDEQGIKIVDKWNCSALIEKGYGRNEIIHLCTYIITLPIRDIRFTRKKIRKYNNELYRSQQKPSWRSDK